MTATALHEAQSKLLEDEPIEPDANAVDSAYLRREAIEPPLPDRRPIKIVDLFSGCGGLTLGALEAAHRSGRGARLSLAIDNDADALNVMKATIGDRSARYEAGDLGAAAEAVGMRITTKERAFFDAPQASLLLAGPPCQGHSSLNNRTRHRDKRNSLYLAVARVAGIAVPAAIIVENVRNVGSDRLAAMATCAAELRLLDYYVEERNLDLRLLGVPQSRVRHVLVATRAAPFRWWLRRAPGRDVRWAIGDLVKREGKSAFDTASAPNEDNRQRINWLFENDAYDLPNELRPACHHSEHSYRAMYGRLRWDAPAHTVTSGFGSMGQGRYVHPSRRRTLTPHEAARLQFLPDFVRFDLVKRRTALATMIANVAPPRLSIVLVQALIEQGLV